MAIVGSSLGSMSRDKLSPIEQALNLISLVTTKIQVLLLLLSSSYLAMQIIAVDHRHHRWVVLFLSLDILHGSLQSYEN